MEFIKKNKLFAAGILTVIIACVSWRCTAILINVTREDYGFIVADGGRSVSWDRSSLPVTLYVDPSAQEWLEAVDRAAEQWNAIVGQRVFNVVSASGFDRSECRSTGTISDPAVFVRQSLNDPSGEGGRAKLHWNSKFNIRCVDLVLARNAPKELWDKIVAHEFGHILGLAHDKMENSIMYYG